MYKYYLLYRPAAPGTIPKNGLENIVNYDNRQYESTINRDVWGYVEYTRPLTEKEIASYELMDAGAAQGTYRMIYYLPKQSENTQPKVYETKDRKAFENALMVSERKGYRIIKMENL